MSAVYEAAEHLAGGRVLSRVEREELSAQLDTYTVAVTELIGAAAESLDAWQGEEASVKAEHRGTIHRLGNALRAMGELL